MKKNVIPVAQVLGKFEMGDVLSVDDDDVDDDVDDNDNDGGGDDNEDSDN